MTKTIDLLSERTERLNRSLDRYYSNAMVDMILSTPGHSFIESYGNVKLTWVDYIKYYLLEIKTRISYAIEALKGNYGSEDY